MCLCVCVTVQLDFLSEVLTAVSGDGELDVFLRKGRRQGAITLLFSPHVFFPCSSSSSSSSSSPALLLSCAEDVSALDRCLPPLV